MKQAQNKVEYVLKNLEPWIKKVNFIVGRGNHSKNNIPLVKPAVLHKTAELGFKREIMETNPGVVSVMIE